MKSILKFTSVCCLILSSCTLGQEDLAFRLESDFSKKVNEILENPDIYSSIEPQKINPFDFDPRKISVDAENTRTESTDSYQIPEELVNASESFQKTIRSIFLKSKAVKPDDIVKLAYAIELEVVNSNLTQAKKDFVFLELAALKAVKSLEPIETKNGRIMCDSQWECDVTSCMAEKMEDWFGSDVNWIDLIHNTYSLPLSFPVAWASCTWDATFAE